MRNFTITSIFLILPFLYDQTQVSARVPQSSNQTSTIRDSITLRKHVEKIHIHFDRAHYSAGDTIWFKSYVVDRSHQLTELSGVLYVDLMDEAGRTVYSSKIPLEAGMGWGDIPLDRQLPAGRYIVIAYTNWLKNFGEEFVFKRAVQVDDLGSKQVVVASQVTRIGEKNVAQVSFKRIDGVPLSNSEVTYSVTSEDGKLVRGQLTTDTKGVVEIILTRPGGLLTTTLSTDIGPVKRKFQLPVETEVFDVQFFPEGGELVSNLASRVGVKVTGADGLGKKASGYITNQHKVHIASFETEFAGMGVFGLNPQTGDQYTAHVMLEKNQIRTFPLPVSKDNGYVMTISSDSTDLIARIKGSRDKNDVVLNLLVQGGGRTLVNLREALKLPQLIVRIPKAELQVGVNRITLTANTLPVAERLVFIDRFNNLNISLTGDQDSYHLHSEVKSLLKVNDSSGIPVLGSFSMSITDADRVIHDEETEPTILSNLLLTSEVRGNVESPNYYFMDVDSEKRHHLDILMLTQGWRKFEPETSSLPIKFDLEKSLRVAGNVLTATNTPARGSTVNLIVGDGSQGIFSTKSNEKGEFAFDSLYFEGRTRLSLNALNAKGKPLVNIIIDQVQSPAFFSSVSISDPIMVISDSTLLAHVNKDEVNHMLRVGQIEKMQMLDEVKVTAQRIRAIPESVNINSTSSLYSLPQNHFELYSSMDQALQSKIPSLEFRGNRMLFRSDSIRVYIDGAPMDQGFLVRDINVADVAGVEVLTGPQSAVYGDKAILFVTLKSGITKSSFQMGQAIISMDGYRIDRLFYSPRFDQPRQTQLPDLRKTIYWNPQLLTRDGVSQEFSFYTGKSGQYRFVIEGVDEFGRLVRQVFTRQVK